jgi:hypothetical protein
MHWKRRKAGSPEPASGPAIRLPACKDGRKTASLFCFRSFALCEKRSGCIEAAYAALRGFGGPDKGFSQQRPVPAKCGGGFAWEWNEAIDLAKPQPEPPAGGEA